MSPPVAERVFDQLHVEIYEDGEALARAAATRAAGLLRVALAKKPTANVMLATGNSQLEFLRLLVADPGIDWPRIVAFHMDEYVGMSAAHPASFQRYMRERVAARAQPGEFHYLDGAAPDAEVEAARYATRLRDHPLDLCCLGVGENGHLAFNDPPVADFNDPLDVKVVELDDRCKQQQVGEGHFPTIADVPRRAITVTVPALLRAAHVLALVPEGRKAEAVRRALQGPISTACPASILRTTPHAILYLDHESSALLD